MDENIDLSVFDERYKNDQTGAAAIHPKILLKVILLGYAKGLDDLIGDNRVYLSIGSAF